MAYLLDASGPFNFPADALDDCKSECSQSSWAPLACGVHTIFSQQAFSCLAGRIQLVLGLETPCSSAATDSLPWEVRMHSASKIKRYRGFSVSPSRKEGLSTPNAPVRLCSLHLPVTSQLLLKPSPLWTAFKLIWGGGNWLFTTFPQMWARGKDEVTLQCCAWPCKGAFPDLMEEHLSTCPPSKQEKTRNVLVPHSTQAPPQPEHPTGDPSTSTQHIRGSSRQQMGWIFPARIDWAAADAYPCKNALLWGFPCSSLALCGQDMH